MATGRVDSWTGQIGFLIDDADEARIFFGDRALRGLRSGDIHKGMILEFDRESPPRGRPQATNVRRPGGRAAPPPPSTAATEALPSEIPLPRTTQKLIAQAIRENARIHPGLRLDKYLIPPPKQEQQRDILRDVADAPGDPALLRELWSRREAMFPKETEGIYRWGRTTEAPLTLHLARASALENAGICLHPIYGFTFLPGTGLKGMARAYAETAWLPEQSDKAAAWQTIEDVFGWAPNRDRNAQIKDPQHPTHQRFGDDPKKEIKAHAGNILFHDAWPIEWPRLFVDIVNSHYPKYYQGEAPPGDWDSPNPVYFLAIEPGTTFEFALAKRRDDVPDEVLNNAQKWLDGALTHLGCGAKTSSGYGGFTPVVEWRPCPNRAVDETTLELVTPAFLAGAQQTREDCDLRPATFKNLLRWWWRAAHAGYVHVDTLRRMEAAVWGDTGDGGAIRITIEKLSHSPEPKPCPFKVLAKNNRGQDVLRFDYGFLDDHGLLKASQGLTQGLAYASYGMDEMDAGDIDSRKRRWYAPPGSKWRIRLTARPSVFYQGLDPKGKKIGERKLEAEAVLDQARMAVWWFCKLGGIGSKSRNGFGSFADVEFANFEGGRWKTHGKAFREACGLPGDQFDPSLVGSASLQQMRELADSLELKPWLEVPTHWFDAWKVLDEIGAAMQAFNQAPRDTGHGKHCDAKRHLGLPRSIHKGRESRELHSARAKVDERGKKTSRNAKPAHYHVARSGSGLIIRVTAFPTADTRAEGIDPRLGWQQSNEMMRDLLAHLGDYLQESAQDF